jgi:hypothetical protein
MDFEENVSKDATNDRPVLGTPDLTADDSCGEPDCDGTCDTCCRFAMAYTLKLQLGHLIPDEQGDETDDEGQPVLRRGWPQCCDEELEEWMDQATPLRRLFPYGEGRDEALAIMTWAYGRHADPWNPEGGDRCDHTWADTTSDMTDFIKHVDQGDLLWEFLAAKQTPEFWLERYFVFSPHFVGCGRPWTIEMPNLLYLPDHCTKECFNAILRRARAWASSDPRFVRLHGLWQSIYEKGTAADPDYGDQPLGHLVNNWLVTHVWSTRP